MPDPPPPPPTDLEFDCPLCDGAFEISSEYLGQEVECPHCGGAVQLQAEEDEAGEAPAGDEPSIAEQEPLAAAAAEEVEAEAPSEPAIETPPPAPEAESPAPEPPPQPAPAPPKPRVPLTPEERAALRRQLNAILAIAGAVVLVLAFFLLSWLAEG